jgi:CRISPR-associated exonuclease Cas4
MQVAAQCLLVEEVYGVRPPFGIVVLADGIREKVPFTPKLERRLLQTMADMRDLIATETEPGPRWVAPKCRACSFVETCWE